ncbi:MAG TPA: 5'/3'-nucleotidase SurE [Firmicutes bacterium]|nr:5'/3'-nucleotidase SurE [Bacillota bacterium]
MRILLTNDDGIYAEGIKILEEYISREHEVFLVAPNHEQSATGHAITMHRPLRAEKIDWLFKNAVGAWAVNGTPSDCVKLAVEALIKENPPDLVISGINKGYNLGTDVLYSGTVSAAVEAVIMDLPAIAVSVEGGDTCPNYVQAAAFIGNLVKTLEKKRIDNDTVLNINLPDPGDGGELKGVMITSLGVRHYQNTFEERVDPRGKTYYWLAGELINKENKEGSDVKAVEDGYISITPLKFNLTDEKRRQELVSWKISVDGNAEE